MSKLAAAFFLLIFLWIDSVECFAIDSDSPECKSTPTIFIAKQPGQVAMSNNLIRSPGGVSIANGRIVIINGRVLDDHCIPISNATVDIWHNNTFGFTQIMSPIDEIEAQLIADKLFAEEYVQFDDDSLSTTLKSGIEDNSVDKDIAPSNEQRDIIYDNNFQGSGRTYTDNMGYYKFITIYPGAINRDVPSINFKVTHEDFLEFTTIMFFEENNNIANKHFKSSKHNDLLLAQKEFIMNGNVMDKHNRYMFDIVLASKNPYRR